MTSFFTLLLAALAVGLGNFGASVGIGISGVDSRTRIKVGLVFGVFESGMPLVGLLIGNSLAHIIGDTGRYAGGALLMLTGAWSLLQVFRAGEDSESVSSTATGRLLITALALSVDNLVVGFSLGVQHVDLLEALFTFATVSIALAIIGLEFGRRLGARFEAGGDYIAGGVLIVIGVLVMAGLL